MQNAMELNFSNHNHGHHLELYRLDLKLNELFIAHYYYCIFGLGAGGHASFETYEASHCVFQTAAYVVSLDS